MKNDNGQIIYEIGDTVQVVSGDTKLCVGIVIEVIGSELRLWNKSPGDSKRLDWQASKNDVRFIGKGFLRPARPGEPVRSLEPMQHPAPRSRSIFRPKQPKLTHPITPSQPQSADSPPQSSPGRVPPVEPLLPAAAGPKFGGVDSESISIPRPPGRYPEPTPEMLQPAVFKAPSARDLHKLPKTAKQEHHEHREGGVPVQSQEAASAEVQGQGRNAEDNSSHGGETHASVEIQLPSSTKRTRRRKVSDVAPAANDPLRNGVGSPGVQGSPAEGSPTQV